MEQRINEILINEAIEKLTYFKNTNEGELIEKIEYTIKTLKLIKLDKNFLKELYPYTYNKYNITLYKYLIKCKDKFNQNELNKLFLFSAILIEEARIRYKASSLTPDNQKTYKEIDKEYESIRKYLFNLNFQDTELETILEYIKNGLYIDITSDIITKKTNITINNASKTIQDINNRIAEIDNEIETKEKILHNLTNEADSKIKKLEDIKEEFEKAAFDGLSKGFNKLLKDKKKSKKYILVPLFIMGILIIIIPLYNLSPDFFRSLCPKLFPKPNQEIASWQKLLIGTGLEFVFIYYFRIILNQYNILKTQIMQLELRHNLCKYIRIYANYAKEIEPDNKKILEKFENLIFSNIFTSDDKIPSTFDGMEQLASFIKEIKS